MWVTRSFRQDLTPETAVDDMQQVICVKLRAIVQWLGEAIVLPAVDDLAHLRAGEQSILWIAVRDQFGVAVDNRLCEQSVSVVVVVEVYGDRADLASA